MLGRARRARVLAPASGLLRAVLLALLLVLTACLPHAAVLPADPAPALPFATAVAAAPAASRASPQALAYLGDALDVIQATALASAQVDWPALHRDALAIARTAQTPQQTYPAIRHALLALHDRHSGFLEPAQAQYTQLADAGPLPAGRRLPPDLGYLALPGLPTPSFGDAPYATAAHQVIRSVDADGTCGWVVDLRGNTGGNMWPMLAGVGPIMGEGVVGSFVDARGQRTAWHYRDGQALIGNDELDQLAAAQVTVPPYALRRPQPPVAVLTDAMTASAGEAVAVAFRGRPNTRSFGQPTAGVPTANRVIELSDGAWLIVTVARDADRTGQTYDAPIAPDEVVVGRGMGDADPVLRVAMQWLRTQPACH